MHILALFNHPYNMLAQYGIPTINLIYNLTIEKVQRRAACWTLGNYDYHSNVSAMLQDLDWPTLQYC